MMLQNMIFNIINIIWATIEFEFYLVSIVEPLQVFKNTN